MNTVKDLMNNEELMKEITEDLENTHITYEVWAIGYNRDSCITDTEMLIGEFTDPEKAIEKAKALTLADIVYQASEEDNGIEPCEPVAYISIEVETVIEDEDGAMNIGTIYKKELLIDEEYSEETGLKIVELAETDYSPRSDGTIRVSCELLKNFNKNDYVRFKFINEVTKPTFTYKIISKNTGNQYICEYLW